MVARYVGVESAHGFGDCCFNIPLIKALSEKFGTQIGVAVEEQCSDAYLNVPWISELIYIPQMHHGFQRLSQLGYSQIFQITQNEKFFEFREHDHTHSLIDTALCTGFQLGVHFDHRPLFIPTSQEVIAHQSLPIVKPLIAIESVYKSGQSWADTQAFAMIMNKYQHTHQILWLSHGEIPQNAAIIPTTHLSRRELICCLHRCERFFSVGSGFFCACLALEAQPPEVICLWIDDFYRYESRLAELQWHKNIKWAHNPNELRELL